MAEENRIEKISEFNSMIFSACGVYIYGAGIVSYGVSEAVFEVYGREITGYIVTQKTADTYVGKPLYDIKTLQSISRENLIIVATPVFYHAEIRAILQKNWGGRFIVLTEMLQYEIMGQYYKKSYGLDLIGDYKIFERSKWEKKSCNIFMAGSVKDTPLKNRYELSSDIIGVQAGAALSDAAAEMVRDDTGENISFKNRDYSELTVTYWAWKNRNADYMGICHYRRILDMPDNSQGLLDGNIGAILPLPYLCYGDTSFQYLRYVPADYGHVFTEMLKQTGHSDIIETMNDRIIYSHNMLIARNDIFRKYCEWMFPILFEFEERIGKKDNRYIGYFGEVLTSAFFIINRTKINILHAPEKWLV